MTNKSEPAFPGCVSVGPSGDVYTSYNIEQVGLIKREYFAAMAMQGLLSSDLCMRSIHESPGKPNIVTSQIAVSYADALIEELNK